MPGTTSTALRAFSHDLHHETDAAKRKGGLQKVISGVPLDIVAVDILSGLPTSRILVLTDYFTKWSEA